MAQIKYNLGTIGGMTVTELWSGSVGNLAGIVNNVKITLNDDFTNYKFLVFDFNRGFNGGSRYYSRVISVQQFTNLFNNTDTIACINFNWGYGSDTDYFDIYQDSTTRVLNISSNSTQCTRIVGIN